MLWLESTKKRVVVWVALAWLLASLIPQSAYADAKTHFRRGETAYQQANYEIAIQEWRKAYRLEKKPRIQHNLALAYERLGRLEEAKRALEIFLKSADPDDPAYGEATARLNSIEQRLARTGIQIKCRVEGALIKVDGREWGRTPRPDKISVSPGSHDVVIRHSDYRDFVSNVVVPAGQVVEVNVNMKSRDGSDDDEDTEPYDTESADQIRPDNRIRANVSGDASGASDSVFEDSTFWYLLGAGLTVSAVGALLWTIDRHEELQGCDDSATYFCRNEDKVRGEQGAAFLLTTLLAAGAIGVVIYGIVHDTSDDGDERAGRKESVSAACSIAPLAAQCGLRF